jgi:hypothetical protein
MSSVNNCYFAGNSAGNKWISAADGSTYDSCVFCQEVGGSNDSLIHLASGSVTITRCLVLLAASGSSTGYILNPSGTSGSSTVEHNLMMADAAHAGGIAIGNLHAAYSGEIASARANLAYATGSGDAWVIVELSASSFTNDAVTVAGYNGFKAAVAGPYKYNSGSNSGNINGYYQLEISSGAAPNSQLGNGDFSADPSFVDSTRNFIQWAHTQHGTAATWAAALAYIQANPGQVGALLTWVKAGYVPTNNAYLHATYPGDAATTDANGNPLNGTVGPMGFLIVATAGKIQKPITDYTQSRRAIWAE